MLPLKIVIFHSYVRLPEGNQLDTDLVNKAEGVGYDSQTIVWDI